MTFQTAEQQQEQARARDQAENNLADIQALRASQAWARWLLPRLERLKADALKGMIDSNSAQVREEKRQRYLAVVEVLGWPEADEASAKRVLEGR